MDENVSFIVCLDNKFGVGVSIGKKPIGEVLNDVDCVLELLIRRANNY